MVTYPVSVQRKSYRGSDPITREQIADYNHLAGMLEDYLNEQFENQKDQYHTYPYDRIAADLNLELEIVSQILSSDGGGHNGFTVYKPPQAP